MAFNSRMISKLKNKDCAHKIKYGSPKLQEVLREKCRERMREKRSELFNRRRFDMEADSKSMKDTLMDIVRKEFKSLATSNDNLKSMEIDEPLNLEVAIELENQIIKEHEQWILEEYEKISQEEIEHLLTYAEGDSKDVFCPMCQKALLIEDNNCVHCRVCEMQLNNRKLEDVKYLINESVNVHAFNCTNTPIFTVIFDDPNFNLYIICNDCNTFALIC